MEEIYKILVVDDDEVDRMAVRRALLKADIQIEISEAANYTEAIATTESLSPDCVFLDYRLPDKNGLSLVQELRRRGYKIPLVVLTGQGDEEIAVELMKAGASDYLSKSRISSGILSRVLRNSIRIYRAEMQVEEANQQLRKSNELLLRKNQILEKQRQQIQLQNLKLSEASQLKSQFLATMSHELRTPMNAIIGFSQMLLRPTKGPLTPQQRDMVERILNNGTNLLTLLNEILDFSKIEAGRLELKLESFNLEHLVTETVAEMRSLADQKNLALEVHLHLSDVSVTNDPSRLRQVLVNLLSNAIKFTETGGVWVTISETAPNQIAIAVRDTGIGIATADLDTIFEAFRQVDQTITRKHAGTGLGLAITDSLVQMMQGHITVESQPEQGSIFQIHIPRHVPAMEANLTTETPKSNLNSLQVG
jgi:signal transduction histidine kinase